MAQENSKITDMAMAHQLDDLPQGGVFGLDTLKSFFNSLPCPSFTLENSERMDRWLIVGRMISVDGPWDTPA